MKNKKIPMRKCVGCMESKPKGELVRIARYEDIISVDPSGKAKGRGVYICPNRECMEKARKRRSLQRSFETDISEETLQNIFEELEKYGKQGN